MKKAAGILFVVLLICSPVFSQTFVGEDYYSIKQVSDSVVANCKTDEEKVIAIVQFVDDKINSSPDNGLTPALVNGMSTMAKLDAGVGWCNHQVGVAMRLMQAQGISSRMIFLTNDEGTSSPHTIGEVLINGKYLVFDPMCRLEKDGRLLTRKEWLSENLTERIGENKASAFANPGIIAVEMEPL